MRIKQNGHSTIRPCGSEYVLSRLGIMLYICASSYHTPIHYIITLHVRRYILFSKLLYVIMPETWIIETPQSIAAPAVHVEP